MKKSTMIRSLLLSGLSVLLCVSMLMGSTFAWFTDTVESGINTIVAGNLDIELYHADKGTSGVLSLVKKDTVLFDDVDSNLWEPGAMVYEKFAVENAGTLALKYALTLNVADATVIDGVSFASMLKVAVVENKDFVYNRENIAALTNWQSLASFTLEGVLAAGAEDDVFGIVIWWQPSENDNLFNMNNGKTGTASVKVGVNLFATQVEAESDSFGSDYDADAPIVSSPVARPENATALNIKGAEDVIIGLPADVVENLPEEVEEIGLSVSEPVVAGNTITFASIELVDQDGKVIDLTNNTTPITVTIPAQDVFAPGTTVVIYHDGEYVAAATVNADKTISYEVAHLCEVSVGAAEAPEADDNGIFKIGTVADLFGFAQSVNAGNTYENKTVVLTADIDLKNAAWTPIGRIGKSSTDFTYAFKGTFDGQNYTVSNLNVSNDGWAGLFGVAYKANIKNVNVSGVTINSNRMAGAIVGQIYGCIDNCHVEDAVITVVPNASGNSYDNGDKVGGIVGWLGDNNNKNSLTNCSATNVSIKGYRDIGGIAGYVAYSTTVAGNKVNDVAIIADQATNYYGDKDVNANAIWGRNSVSSKGEGVIAENNTEANVTVEYVVLASNAASAQAALDNAVSGTTIKLAPGVDYGTLYIRPVAGKGNTVTDCDYLVYRNEMLRNVENLTIVGAEGATIEAIVVEAGYVKDSGSTGYVVDIKNLVIDSVEFSAKYVNSNTAHKYSSPLFFDLTYINVDGLTVKNCKLIGDNDKMNFVYFYGSGNPSNSTFETAAKNITITGNTVDGIARLCELRQAENVTITNNTIKNTALHGMLLTVDGGTYTGNVTITGNTADGINERFVRMAGAGNAAVVIKDNTIVNYMGADADYIKVTDANNVTIENNTITYAFAE